MLPTAETRPIMRSLKPCVCDLSAGESWSASRDEPPTKQKFQPRPSRKSATASGATAGERGASVHATIREHAPVVITAVRPQRSASPPERIEKANMPNVWDEITREMDGNA